MPICAASDRKRIKSAKDLAGGPFVHILGHEDNWHRYFAKSNLSMDMQQVRLFTDTTNAALSLVASGGGYAAIVSRLAEASIAAGRKIAIAGDPVSFPQAHYLVNSVVHTTPRAEVEIFKNWLREIFHDG